MQKATRHQTRDHNSRLVLKTIFNDGPISRAEIARRTRLTRPTVSTLAAELLAVAAHRDLPQLDEKLYLDVFAPPETVVPRRASARR